MSFFVNYLGFCDYFKQILLMYGGKKPFADGLLTFRHLPQGLSKAVDDREISAFALHIGKQVWV